ncbi:MAG: class I SAM-dependent methyltransferase [Chloroflexi bacterium HGW-Chloroflexi-10]|nr:MAG: class I SAM-dependent methyltransferase [Chloroflexi bacterium HGW-Chloroflexi-10]
MNIKQAFDQCAQTYDADRPRFIPCFDDFYATTLDVIPFDSYQPIRILDLGAGTGLLSALVAQRFPHAHLTLIDISEEMLAKARERFASSPQDIRYEVKDYRAESIGSAYDLIVSALSIHHLTAEEKADLFRTVYAALTPGGFFVNADQVLGQTPAIEQTYRTTWLCQVKATDISPASLAAGLKRTQQDKMSTLADQLTWLTQAGFNEVNTWFQSYSFVVYSGQKV